MSATCRGRDCSGQLDDDRAVLCRACLSDDAIVRWWQQGNPFGHQWERQRVTVRGPEELIMLSGGLRRDPRYDQERLGAHAAHPKLRPGEVRLPVLMREVLRTRAFRMQYSRHLAGLGLSVDEILDRFQIESMGVVRRDRTINARLVRRWAGDVLEEQAQRRRDRREMRELIAHMVGLPIEWIAAQHGVKPDTVRRRMPIAVTRRLRKAVIASLIDRGYTPAELEEIGASRWEVRRARDADAIATAVGAWADSLCSCQTSVLVDLVLEHDLLGAWVGLDLRVQKRSPVTEPLSSRRRNMPAGTHDRLDALREDIALAEGRLAEGLNRIQWTLTALVERFPELEHDVESTPARFADFGDED